MQLQVLTILARKAALPELSHLILEGRIRDAVNQAEEMLRDRDAGRCSADATLVETAQLCADLMLALDRTEEAEEAYRLAVKLAHTGPRGAVRIVSCRSTGFLSLHQQRFGTAAACFSRLAADDAATPAQRVEALCALAMARDSQSQRAAARHALDEAGQLARDFDMADLALMTSLMRIELAARNEIRTHDLLQDHVFWQASSVDREPASDRIQPLVAIDNHLAANECPALIAGRLTHLRDLLRCAYGGASLASTLIDPLAKLRGTGLVTLELQARLDTALVAIAQRHPDIARNVLLPLQGRDSGRRRCTMELSYCQAKISMLMGQVDDAMLHYQRYALESMQRLRAVSAAPMAVQASSQPQTEGTRDDIEMRLPAKYRRAYRYLQEHLDCAELSVREIADSMGVTERALQTAFKTHLGMTPGEVVQRCRVERIRAELLREDSCDPSVIETAARWGIRNRSTLITSYRKYFSETPTQTLARRGAAISGVAA